ncbi:MAG: nitrous oxide reductase family maturation protein NosD [Saprospiraceae bacterium]
MKPLLLPFIYFLFTAFSANATVWTVCGTCAQQHIRETIAAASAGDTLLVQNGTYREGGLVLDKPLTLLGQGRPILDGEGRYEIMVVSANEVTVSGFDFVRAGHDNLKDFAALRARDVQHFTFTNNRIFDAFFGIYIEKSKNGIIHDNYIHSHAVNEMTGGNGIHAWYASGLDIAYNHIVGHRDGIYFEFVEQTSIHDNISEQNIRYGLHFMFSNDDTYACNTFSENGAGVAVMFSKKIIMQENQFVNNWGSAAYGLLLKEIYDAEIIGNTFESNTIGIFLEGATRIQYGHNHFLRNGWAVQITGGCESNRFVNNNFSENTLDMIVNSRMQENTFDGNYWREYSGYDLNRDAVGDVPHHPVKLFSYVLEQCPETIVLLRSFLVDLLNFSEKVSPALTPQDIADHSPLMSPVL